MRLKMRRRVCDEHVWRFSNGEGVCDSELRELFELDELNEVTLVVRELPFGESYRCMLRVSPYTDRLYFSIYHSKERHHQVLTQRLLKKIPEDWRDEFYIGLEEV